MNACPESYPGSRRECNRPAGHGGAHGALHVEYRPYPRPRPVTDWIEEDGTILAGHELGGLILNPAVLDGHARAVCDHIPEEYLVTGEDVREDGIRFLRFAMNVAWIEAKTDYRDVAEPGAKPDLVYVCPECEGRSGKHSKVCKSQ